MAGTNILQSYLIKLGVAVDRKDLDGFIGSVAKGLAGMAKLGAAAVVAFGVVQAGVLKLAGSEADLNDLSERVGLTTEQIERMGFVASQSGSNARALQGSLEGLRRIAGNAAMGMTGAVRVFDDIDIKATDASGAVKDTATLLDELGAALSTMDHGRQQSTLQRLGMDRTLVRTLTEDTRELQEQFTQMANVAGLDFKRSAQAASELMDEYGKTTTFAKLVTKSLGTGLMEDFRKSLERGRKWVTENVEFVQSVIKNAVRIIQAAATIAGRFIMRIGQAFVWLHEKTGGLTTALAVLGGIVLWLGGPVTAILGLFTGVFLIIDDLITALEGGKSYFDWSPWLDDIRAAQKWLGELADEMRDELLSALQDVVAWLDKMAQEHGFTDINQVLRVIGGALPGIIRDFAAFAAYVGGTFWNILKGVFGWIGDMILFITRIFREWSGFVINVLSGDFPAAFQNLKNIGAHAAEFIKSGFGRLAEFIKGVINVIDTAIDKTLDLLGLRAENPEEKQRIVAQRRLRQEIAKLSDQERAQFFANNRTNAAVLGVSPGMLQTAPMVSPEAMRDHRNASGGVTNNNGGDITQTNSNTFNIYGSNNAEQIGREVDRVNVNNAAKVARNARRGMG